MSSLAGPLNVRQVERAVDALLNHVQKKSKTGDKEQLIESSDPVTVVIGMKKIPRTNGRVKPYMIKLKHSMYDAESTETCLITRPPQRKYKDLLQSLKIDCINKVIDLKKLSSKYKQYEAKRQLSSAFDVFFADEKIIPKLPHLLGKEFFQKKKIPLTVKLGKNNLGDQFKRLLNSSPFFLAEGMCSVLKVGHTGMQRKQIVENIIVGMDAVAKVLPKGWELIQALNIRTHDSIALPIYSSLPAVSTITATPEKSGKKRKSTGKPEEDEADRPKKVKKGAEKAKEEAEEAAEEDKGQASAKKEVKQAAKPEAAKTPKSVQKKKISTPKSTAKASAKKVKAAS